MVQAKAMPTKPAKRRGKEGRPFQPSIPGCHWGWFPPEVARTAETSREKENLQ